MTDRRAVSTRSRTRWSWAVFSTVSAIALLICFLAVLDATDPARAGLATLGGLVVVGLAAVFVDWSISGLAPPADGGGRSSAVVGHSLGGAGFAGGGTDGGGAGCGHGGGAPGC